ncbi:MAG: hypothetical protein INQ03_08530 [Candidatus Heimdallarchaeota archaeon]|nr:hypothetical protein [Candidatus Heimdallarchaeota archaeon]
MFRRRKETEIVTVDDHLEIPNLDQLQKWVLKLITKLELEDGQFTILPAYGGVLLYIKHQGISWIPYSEVRMTEGQFDKNKLVESGSLLGGLAIVKVTGGIALPFLLIPSVIKGWYRSMARPSPKKSVTFLQSMIDEVSVETTKLNLQLLEKFEDSPILKEKSEELKNMEKEMITYSLKIKKKYFSKRELDNSIFRFFKYLTSVFTGNEVPIFAIHPQADTKAFLNTLEKYKIKVSYKEEVKEKDIIPDDGIII